MNTFSPPLPKQPIKDMKQLANTPATQANGVTSRSSSGLRDLLFDEIENFRKGNGDVDRAKAIAQLSQTIIASAKLDIEFARLLSDGELPSALQPLSLSKK
jgi:hypothetical protein